MGTGCPPVEVLAEGLPSGKVVLSGSVSSQYLTALLMAAPLATGAGAEGDGLRRWLSVLLLLLHTRGGGLGFETQLSIFHDG